MADHEMHEASRHVEDDDDVQQHLVQHDDDQVAAGDAVYAQAGAEEGELHDEQHHDGTNEQHHAGHLVDDQGAHEHQPEEHAEHQEHHQEHADEEQQHQQHQDQQQLWDWPAHIRSDEAAAEQQEGDAEHQQQQHDGYDQQDQTAQQQQPHDAVMGDAENEAESREALAKLLLQNTAAQDVRYDDHEQHGHEQGGGAGGDESAMDQTHDAALQELAQSAIHGNGHDETEGDLSHMDATGDDKQEADGTTTGEKVVKKRARSKQKITRNRKITSCLECRARKQKCDRARPICGNCVEYARGMCTYVDGTGPGAVAAAAAAAAAAQAASGAANDKEGADGAPDAKRVRYDYGFEGAEAGPSADEQARYAAIARRSGEEDLTPEQLLLQRRRDLIAQTADMGRNSALPMDIRVKCARAAAVGEALFGSPTSSTPPLKLPKPGEAKELLEIYMSNVELVNNSVHAALNRPRISTFLRWWHSDDPETLPPDPPLVPLLLTMFALALQAKRTMHIAEPSQDASAEYAPGHLSVMPGGRPKTTQEFGHADARGNCSSERQLLEVAGRCIDSLQIVCPSNWSTAFAAPLDLVRASLLRGLWHLGELHLQFATICFTSAIRLAHAAGLHREPKHWKGMGREESQARRNIWWNCVLSETLHANKMMNPSIIDASGFDTEVPADYGALESLFRRAEQLESAAFGRPISMVPIPSWNFDFYSARFDFVRLYLQHRQALTSNEAGRSVEALHAMIDEFHNALPPDLRDVVMADSFPSAASLQLTTTAGTTEGEQGGVAQQLAPAEAKTRFCQLALLRMARFQMIIAVHRPNFDSKGNFKAPADPQGSLQASLEASHHLVQVASALIRAGPPFVVYGMVCGDLFQAAVILSILCALSAASTTASRAATPPPGDGTTHQSEFQSMAKPIINRAIETFDLVAAKAGLSNVAEQAARYAAALREMNERPGVVRAANAASKEQAVVALGARAPVAEGSGIGLGGQGYPSRRPSQDANTDEANATAAAEAVAAAAAAENESELGGGGTQDLVNDDGEQQQHQGAAQTDGEAAARELEAALRMHSAQIAAAAAANQQDGAVDSFAERPINASGAEGSGADAADNGGFAGDSLVYNLGLGSSGAQQDGTQNGYADGTNQFAQASAGAGGAATAAQGGADEHGQPSSNLELLAAQVEAARAPPGEQGWSGDNGGRGEMADPLRYVNQLGSGQAFSSSGGFAPLALGFGIGESLHGVAGIAPSSSGGAAAAQGGGAALDDSSFGNWDQVLAELEGWKLEPPSLQVTAPPIDSFNMDDWNALERMIEKSLQDAA